MVSAALKKAWELYWQNFGLIAGVLLVIALPLDLLSSYMDYFVFDPDDIRKSFRFSMFLQSFIGIIATASIISIGYGSSQDRQPSFGRSLAIGFRSWLPLCLTNLLAGLTVLLYGVALIIPGIWMSIKLVLTEPVVVCEKLMGRTAMNRSMDLTKNRFWEIFLLVLLYVLLTAIFFVGINLIDYHIPFDYWLIDAAISLVMDFVRAFGTLCFFCAYLRCVELEKSDMAEKSDSEIFFSNPA